MKKLKIISIFFIFFICLISQVSAQEIPYIFTDDIKISVINDNLHHLEININWKNIPKSQAQYIKMVHSRTDANIVYKDGNYNWATENIANTTSLTSNFNNYNPDYKGINYFRACVTTANTIYCSKQNSVYQANSTIQSKTIGSDETAKIKTFLEENQEALKLISNSAYLQGRIGITTSNIKNILESFPTMESFKDIKYLIELVSKDIQNTKEIESFVKKYSAKQFTTLDNIKDAGNQVDNWLDLNARSKEELGFYTLTVENKNKLTTLKDSLKSQYDNFGKKEKTLTINTSDNTSETTRNIKLEANITSNDKKVQISDIAITNLSYKALGIIATIVILYFIFSKIRFSSTSVIESKSNDIPNIFKENTLQILKNNDEYIVEYNGIYNKGVKVLSQNKDNITASIYSYVNSVCKLQVRGNIYEELKNIDIKIPDLKESGNTLYRLYLAENIRSSLKNQQKNEALLIKTDEQDVPWEIMHDGESFLSLKYPIARKIMTRENQRKNETTKNKKPKILFISNPTGDLAGASLETKNIIQKLGKNADITLIEGSTATSTKVFSLLSQNHWDVIHYSGHAFFDSKNPDASGLKLSDSVITASEIKRILNGNPLIFLNACSSGRCDEKDYESTGEDTSGIASSFMIGGAKGVIATLWPVSDSVASGFAGDFYSDFLKNASIGNALLSAKKEAYLQFPNDITWASFIYYGDINLTLNS